MVKGLNEIAIIGGLALLVFGGRFFNKTQTYELIRAESDYDFQRKEIYENIFTLDKNIESINQSWNQSKENIALDRINLLNTNLDKLKGIGSNILDLERTRAETQIKFIQNEQQEARRTISMIQNEINRLNPFHKKRLRSPDLQFKLKQQVRDTRAALFNQSEQRIAAQEFIDQTDSQIIGIRERMTELEEAGTY